MIISPSLSHEVRTSNKISTHLKDSSATITDSHSVRWTIERDIDEGSFMNVAVGWERHELLLFLRWRWIPDDHVEGQKQDERRRQYDPCESHGCKTTWFLVWSNLSLERSELRRDFERSLETDKTVEIDRSADPKAKLLAQRNSARPITYNDESQWHTRVAKIFMIFSLAWRDVLYHRRVYTACRHSHSACLHSVELYILTMRSR